MFMLFLYRLEVNGKRGLPSSKYNIKNIIKVVDTIEIKPFNSDAQETVIFTLTQL